jgi:PAS domain S-box-containing protein
MEASGGEAAAPQEPERKAQGTGEAGYADDQPEFAFDPALRARAEDLIADREHLPSAHYPVNDILALTHELQVHQIELELQNEELRRAQFDLQLTAERYADLYDFAPVGYLSVDTRGVIGKANLTAGAMLGIERRQLVGAPFNRFILDDDVARYHYLHNRMSDPDQTQNLELRLRPAEGEPFWARLEIITRRDPVSGALLWQIAISRIEEQKRAEQLTRQLNQELEERVARRTQQLTVMNRELLEEIARRRAAEAALREREETLEARVAERTAELASLLTVSREISSTLELDEIFDLILEHLHRTIRYTGCGIFLLHGELLTLVAYRGPLSAADLVQSQTTLQQSPLLRTALAQREPLIVNDMASEDPTAAAWRNGAGGLQRHLLGDARAWMGIPLIAKAQPLGILRLDHRDPDYFTPLHVSIAFTLANQTAVAVENARLYAQAGNVAAIEERQRLARELHDSVAQTFYSISLSTHAALDRLSRDPNQVRRHLDHVLELAAAGLTEMKALIFDLQAENIRREGLVAALQRQLSALSARNDIRVDVDLGAEPAATLEVKQAAYGLIREAMQNVVRHAGARALSLQMRQEENRLEIEVRDDGVGFDPATVGPDTLGMRSMRERAAIVGGRVEIVSRPHGGTVVRAELPMPGNDPSERQAAGG